MEIYKFFVSEIDQFKVPKPKRKSPDIRNRVYFCTLVWWAMLPVLQTCREAEVTSAIGVFFSVLVLKLWKMGTSLKINLWWWNQGLERQAGCFAAVDAIPGSYPNWESIHMKDRQGVGMCPFWRKPHAQGMTGPALGTKWAHWRMEPQFQPESLRKGHEKIHWLIHVQVGPANVLAKFCVLKSYVPLKMGMRCLIVQHILVDTVKN